MMFFMQPYSIEAGIIEDALKNSIALLMASHLTKRIAKTNWNVWNNKLLVNWQAADFEKKTFHDPRK